MSDDPVKRENNPTEKIKTCRSNVLEQVRGNKYTSDRVDLECEHGPFIATEGSQSMNRRQIHAGR